MPHLSLNTAVGPLTLFEEDDAIVALEWGRAPEGNETPLLTKAHDQVLDYFDRKLTQWDLPLNPRGDAFQRAVWDAMCRIPFGSVRTYGEIARDLSSAARAVGGACGRNPIPIIIPCHRVIGANGRLTGYSGGAGLETKRALLFLEGYYADELPLH